MSGRRWWPFVHRAVHEAMLAAVERDLASVRQQLTDARELHAAYRTAADTRYEAILTRYHDIKVVGGGAPDPVVASTPRAPDVVTQAIIAKSRGNAFLRQHYFALVAERRGLGMDESEIADSILKGQTQDPETEGVPALA